MHTVCGSGRFFVFTCISAGHLVYLCVVSCSLQIIHGSFFLSRGGGSGSGVFGGGVLSNMSCFSVVMLR